MTRGNLKTNNIYLLSVSFEQAICEREDAGTVQFQFLKHWKIIYQIQQHAHTSKVIQLLASLDQEKC